MTEKDPSEGENSGIGADTRDGESGPQGSSPPAPPPPAPPPPAPTNDADDGPVEDLEQEPIGVKKAPIQPEIGSQPASVPYDIGQAQETTRGKIALILLFILALVIVLAFLYLNSLPLNDKTKIYTENLVTILQIIFGPLVTLVATALGYYFGSKNDKLNSPPASSGGGTTGGGAGTGNAGGGVGGAGDAGGDGTT